MAHVIARVPTSFDVSPFAGRWFHWTDIAACFWPGRGGRATVINPNLAPVRTLGGVYCFAWSAGAPPSTAPTNGAVRYIGETNEFLRRMGQFGNSAGFWGKRRNGHSAGWRWPAGRSESAWVSFYLIGNSHHIFTRNDVVEILNLQPRGNQAKPYQVKQVRGVIVAYRLAGDAVDPVLEPPDEDTRDETNSEV